MREKKNEIYRFLYCKMINDDDKMIRLKLIVKLNHNALSYALVLVYYTIKKESISSISMITPIE